MIILPWVLSSGQQHSRLLCGDSYQMFWKSRRQTVVHRRKSYAHYDYHHLIESQKRTIDYDMVTERRRHIYLLLYINVSSSRIGAPFSSYLFVAVNPILHEITDTWRLTLTWQEKIHVS